MEIILETVKPTVKQISILYEQLKKRKYFISHKNLPTFEEHTYFVKNNPYRKWFIIKVNNIEMGSIYVQNDNSIGVNGIESLETIFIKKIFELIHKKLKPLPPLPSSRYKDFFVNISVDNKTLINKFSAIGFKPSQITYITPKID